MNLKCPQTAVYFLITIIIFPCYLSFRYDIGDKMRADNIEDYGERLSSIDHGLHDSYSSSGNDIEDRQTLSGIVKKKDQDFDQHEGMSVQEDKADKLQERKSQSKEELTLEENVSQEKITKEEKNVKADENSKEQLVKDSEENNISGHERKIDGKPTDKPENENMLLESEEEKEKMGKLSEEHKISSREVKNQEMTTDTESSTKCTTDKLITIGDYTPPQDSESNDNDGGDAVSDGDVDGKGKNDEDNDESEKKVSKVYKGPKPAKAPDHYIDDV